MASVVLSVLERPALWQGKGPYERLGPGHQGLHDHTGMLPGRERTPFDLAGIPGRLVQLHLYCSKVKIRCNQMHIIVLLEQDLQG